MRNKLFQEILDETPKDVEIFVRWYADIILKINQILKVRGITQKALAEKLDKSPSEIHKWLSGEHNFTLRSLAKLQAELGESLLEVPQRISPIYSLNSSGKLFKPRIVHNESSSSDWEKLKTNEAEIEPGVAA